MNRNIRKITYAAIAAALVFVVTWTIKITVPGTNGGYINLGDTVIYFTAYLLGGPIAAASSAVGSALADLAAGAVVYAPATFVIKGLMGLIFGLMTARKKSFAAYLIAALLGGAIMTAGYALYETAVFGLAYALTSLPYNLLQWAGSVAAALLLFPAARRVYDAVHLD
jgi:uncharacterized membrane protein